MSSYTWIDETIEHSEQDAARAEALAKKLTSILNESEQRMFRRMTNDESGYDYDPYEDCECDYCLKMNHDCNEDGLDECCSNCAIVTDLQECESRKQDRQQEALRVAEQDLEIELIQDKLLAIGARMMRSYEHWGELEQYIQYMESRGDY